MKELGVRGRKLHGREEVDAGSIDVVSACSLILSSILLFNMAIMVALELAK